MVRYIQQPSFESTDIDNPGVPETEFEIYRSYTNIINIERYGMIGLEGMPKLTPKA